MSDYGQAHEEQANEQAEDELVCVEAQCPNCHERRMDELVWDEDGIAITCQTCGEVYTLELEVA